MMKPNKGRRKNRKNSGPLSIEDFEPVTLKGFADVPDGLVEPSSMPKEDFVLEKIKPVILEGDLDGPDGKNEVNIELCDACSERVKEALGAQNPKH